MSFVGRIGAAAWFLGRQLGESPATAPESSARQRARSPPFPRFQLRALFVNQLDASGNRNRHNPTILHSPRINASRL